MNRLRTAVLLALLATLPAARGHAQETQIDLRQENERLRAEVARLTEELAKARAEIVRLQEEIAAARKPARTPPPPLPETPVSVDETVAAASPRAFRAACAEALRAALADETLGEDGSPERRKYLDAIAAWAKRTDRAFTFPVTWTVRVLEVRTEGRNTVARFEAVDPVHTDTALGEPFEAVVPTNAQRTLRAALADSAAPELLVLRGIARAGIAINPTRTAPGPFDNPPLVAPCAEYHLRLELRSLGRLPASAAPPAASGSGG